MGHANAESRNSIARGLQRLLVRRVRIGGEDLVRVVAVAAANLRFERGARHAAADEQRPSSEFVPMSTGVSLKCPWLYSTY